MPQRRTVGVSAKKSSKASAKKPAKKTSQKRGSLKKASQKKTPSKKAPAKSRTPSTKGKRTVAKKANPRLWQQIKDAWMQGAKGGPAGKWNARKAQLAVQEYKRRGGTYLGRKDPGNSLRIWTREDWGYVDGDAKGRYLPKAVRDALTSAERARENARKRGKKGRNVPYSESVTRKMRQAGVI